MLLSTPRTRFDLTSPRYIGPTRTAAAADEVYVVDLRSDTLDLLTRGFDGSLSGFPNACRYGAYSPSVSSDGTEVAFDSCADNLVFGDGNSASDVFAAGQLTPVSSTAPPQSPALLPAPLLTPSAKLTVTVKLTGASLQVQTVLPRAGRVTAFAHWSEHFTRHGSHAAHTAGHTVASASTTASHSGLPLPRLSPSHRYLLAARRPGGLPLTLTVTLRSPAYPTPLSRTLRLSFIQKSARTRRARHSHPAPRRRRLAPHRHTRARTTTRRGHR